MMVADPSQTTEGRGRARRGPTWPWALGSSLFVLLVLVAMLAGRAVVSRTQQVQARVAAPSVPPLQVAAVAHPAGGAQLLALDEQTGRLAALTSREDASSCPPVGTCPAPAPPDAFALLDGATGATIATTPLTGDAAPAAVAPVLLVDSARHTAYAVAPRAVVAFSTLTGARTAGYPLPGEIAGRRLGGAALAADGAEMVVAGGDVLLLLDAASGRVQARRSLQGGMIALDGPVVDTDGARCFVLAAANGRSTLLAFDTSGLQPLAQYNLLAGARLGPLDAPRHALYVLGGDGSTWRVPLDAIRPGASAPPLTPVSALSGAQAFGANGPLGHGYVADPTGVRALDGNGKVLAALPLPVLWPATQLLPVDARRGLVYLLAAHGSVAIVRDGAQTGGTRALAAATAAIFARAALAELLPDSNQDPPFVAPETFPLAAGSPDRPETRTERYWIHFADRGWEGPSAGTASTSVAPAPGRPGAYVVTFAISWQQQFMRQHTWVCLVTPDGAVQLQSNQGDAVP
jgi:hypothetical protein